MVGTLAAEAPPGALNATAAAVLCDIAQIAAVPPEALLLTRCLHEASAQAVAALGAILAPPFTHALFKAPRAPSLAGGLGGDPLAVALGGAGGAGGGGGGGGGPVVGSGA